MRREALGRGIKALLPVVEEQVVGQVSNLPVNKIEPGEFQPRGRFDTEALGELAQSLLTNGVVQPVLVRPKGDGYELIVGERRWRAAKLAGFETIPALIKNIEGRDALEIALIENTQREDLNPVEEASAYQRLAEEFDLTHDQIASKLGKDRSYVSNILRLLKLPNQIKEDLIEGRLTIGHAKAILSCREDKRVSIRNQIIERGLSVRGAEGLVRKENESRRSNRKGETDSGEQLFITSLEEDLQQTLGTKVRLRLGKRGGRLELYYYSHEELNRLLEILKVGTT